MADADLFLLIYTSEDNDWSWCTWEWGIANHPASADTTVIVLQCGTQPPVVDTATRRVNIRKLEEVQGFVKQYFTEPTMFRSLEGEALAPFFTQKDLELKADRLFSAVTPLVAPFDPTVEWSTWPFLQIELPLSSVNKFRDNTSGLDKNAQIETVKESATVSLADPKALAIFGLAGFANNSRFSQLERVWTSAYPSQNANWFQDCCEQIVQAGSEKLPRMQRAPVREVGGDAEFVPVVTRVRRASYLGLAVFDLYFLNVPGRSKRLVTLEMLGFDRFYWKRFSDDKLRKMRLLDISDELKSQSKNRLPLLDDGGRIRYIIHRASIDEFIVANVANAAELTMQNLLQDEGARSMFERTFDVIPLNATMEDAKAAITGDIRDVFITETGSREEPVQGWLTNVDLGKGL